MSDTLAGVLWKPTEGGHLALILVATAATYVVYRIVYSIYDVYFGPLSKFPGPKIRAFSEVPSMIMTAAGTEATVLPALHSQYGPIVRISPREISYAGGAKAWSDIYGFKKSGEKHMVKDMKFYSTPPNRIHSIITAEGADHPRQRKILSHSFADKTLKDLEPMLKGWVEKFRQKLVDKSGEELDLLKYYNCTTFDIMGDLTFGEDLQMLESGEYSDWVKTIFGGIKSRAMMRAVMRSSDVVEWAIENILMKIPAIAQVQVDHWKYSVERVDRRLAKSETRNDLMTKIIEKSGKSGAVDVEELYSNSSTFMIAGTETTATALSGTTYWLLRNPACMERLKKEIRDSHPNAEDITLDSIQRLKYLHATLQEGLRMYPPVPTRLPRMAPPEGVTIEGHWVPPNTSVGVHHMSTYRMESNFKNAYEFHPERWLHDPEYANDRLDAMEPFHVGPRNCIGKNLAWHEMRLILCTALWHFDLELSKESANWHDQKIFTLWEKVPLMVKVTPRTS